MSLGTTEGDSLWRRFLVVCALSAAAIAGPVLDIYGRNPEVFVANRSSGPEIALFGVIVSLGVPAVALALLWMAEWVGGRAPILVYMSLVVILAAATGLVVARQLFPDETIPALAAAVLIVLFVVALDRWFGRVVAIFGLALPVVLFAFLATSAAARLIWEEPELASGAGSVGRPSPIVMIQLDEMPISSIMRIDGSINDDLFPNFARLADEGTWYRNALADSIATTQSIATILTGTRDVQGKSPSSVDHPNNLFTLLAGSYEMHVIEWVADMCPEETCPDYAGRAPAQFTALLGDVGVVYGHLTMPATIREELPSIENAWRGFLGDGDITPGSGVEIDGLPVPPAGRRVEWADWVQRLIDGIEPDSPPTLSYAHLESPHVPWVTNPSGTHYERPEEYTEVEGVQGDGRWVDDPRPALLGFQRHLFQIGFLDRLLGRLFDRLEETNSWDNAMIIVVADHGASFVPGEHRRWPFAGNRDDLYRIPLFIKYPGQTAGDTVDLPVFGVDLLPTIVEVLDIETEWDFDGVSLMRLDGLVREHEPVWWCCDRRGVSTDVGPLFAQVERNHNWVPDQTSWAGVAGVGRYASLVGEPAESLQIRETDQVRWSLDLGKSLAEVELEEGFVQTLLTGRVEMPRDVQSDDLVVVVNGRVAGSGYVSRDSPTGGVMRALISEELVDQGHNDVDILISSGDGAWLDGSAGVLTLDLVTGDGRTLKLTQEGSRRIHVSDIDATEGGWLVTGWSADVDRKLTPDMIYVFVGERLIASGPPDVENRNVVRWFGSEDLLMSGFSFVVPGDEVPSSVDQLTVAAEFGDQAVADAVSLEPLGRS